MFSFAVTFGYETPVNTVRGIRNNRCGC